MPDLVLRALTQRAYDLQKVRISIGNRLCQAYYQAKGVQPGEKPEEVMADKHLLDAIRSDYKRLTDGLVRLPRKGAFEPTQYLSSYSLLVMARSYEETLKAEETAFKALEGQVLDTPIWAGFLAGVKGCGGRRWRP